MSAATFSVAYRLFAGVDIAAKTFTAPGWSLAGAPVAR